MKNIFSKIYQHKKTAVLIGLAVLAVAVLALIKTLKQDQNKDQWFSVKIPMEYDQPLIIATFDYLFNIQPIGARAADRVEIDENTIQYIDAYQSTDVEQIKYPNKLKESLILKGPEHPDRFEYEINVEEYDYRFDADKNLVFYKLGHKGEELYKVFTIPKPFMVEDVGNSNTKKTASNSGLGGPIPNSNGKEVASHLANLIVDDNDNNIKNQKTGVDGGPEGNRTPDAKVTSHAALPKQASNHTQSADLLYHDIGSVEMKIEGNRLILEPDMEWIGNHQYPIIVDPTIEINILNLYSHPQQGEEWIVEFTTQGRADLKIIPADQDTIDDDEFVALYCGDELRIPEILDGDVIYYPNWECPSGGEAGDGIGRVIHYTLLAGKHHLIFEFGDQKADAYNDAAVSDAWWDASWTRRRALTFNNATSSSDLVNFPVLVSLHEEPNNINYASTQNSGEDIRFVNYDGTVLDYEIEKWDEAATSTVWVEIPNIEASTSTQYFYMYYGNSGAVDNATTTGVWDEDYLMVQHLQEDWDAVAIDSTRNGNNGTHTNFYSSTSTVDAKVDGCIDFDGIDDFINVDSLNDDLTSQNFTVSAWVKLGSDHNDFSSLGKTIFNFYEDDSNRYGFYFSVDTSYKGKLANLIIDNGSVYRAYTNQSSWNVDQWYYITASGGTGGLKLYVEGEINYSVVADTTLGFNSISPVSLNIGVSKHTTYPDPDDLYHWMDGNIDEVRISKSARSPDWIAASYESVVSLTSASTTDDFVSFGAEEIEEPWWNTNWSNRIQITYDNTDQSSGLQNFPAVATTTDTNFWSTVQDDYRDLRFINDDGDELYFEIEEFDYAGNDMTAWVKLNYAHSTTTDPIWMYYGNSGAATSTYATTTGVWDENFMGVWHMDGVYDSSRNDNWGDNNGAATTSSGWLSSAFDFTASESDYLAINETNSSLDITGHITITAWINPEGWGSNNYGTMVGKAWEESYAFRLDNETIEDADDTNLELMADYGAVYVSSDDPSVSLSAWQYVAVVYDQSNIDFYVDGVDKGGGADSSALGSTAYDVLIGSDYTSGSPDNDFDGIIDEMRISNTNRHVDWVTFEYCNMNGGCNTYAAEEVSPAPALTSGSHTPEPTNPYRSVTFVVDWNDVGDQVKAKVCKSDALTSQNCDAGFWASSTEFTTDDPISLMYNVVEGDWGVSRDYYIFVCDDSGLCSSDDSGSFSVNSSGEVPNVKFR